MKRAGFVAIAAIVVACNSGAPLDGARIVASMKTAHLDAQGLQSFTAETDPNHLLGRPGQYTTKVSWKVKGEEATVEVFPDLDGAKTRAKYVEEIGKKMPALLQYVVVNDHRRAVLRLPKIMTPTEVEPYKAWLAKL